MKHFKGTVTFTFDCYAEDGDDIKVEEIDNEND